MRELILLGFLVSATRLTCAAEPPIVPTAPATGSQYEVGPAPDWVNEVVAPEPDTTSRGTTPGSTQYLLVDRQLRLDNLASTYTRLVTRLLNVASLRNQSQLKFEFDPERENLRIHRVTVRRGGQIIDALKAGRAEVLQREPDLESGLLSGQLTVHLLLSDMRVGDTLDYSYTIERNDSDWGNRHFAHFTTGWEDDVALSRLSVLVRPGVPLRINNQDVQSPAEETRSGWRHLNWTWSNLKGKTGEDGAPSWVEQFPAIDISQFQSWQEVVNAALPMYAVSDPPSAEFTALVARLKGSGTTDGLRAIAAIKFVQEEVRYTGLELGKGAFRPASPSIVLRRRFGDCKDKTLLAVTLLRAIGIEAAPALVSTRWQATLANRLPSPAAMDHVIVRAKVGGDTYWWDVTATGQAGALREFTQSGFGAALVIRSGVSAIEAIPEQAPASPQMTTKFVLNVRAGLDKDASLLVSSSYRKSVATTKTSIAANLPA
jgi:transglutaminase-like putative cysteine protease